MWPIFSVAVHFDQEYQSKNKVQREHLYISHRISEIFVYSWKQQRKKKKTHSNTWNGIPNCGWPPNYRSYHLLAIKMKPLATNHRVLIWICACPAEEGASKWTKRTYCVFALMVFLFMFGSFALSSLFLYKFLVSDSSGFYALFQAAGAFTAIYLHICAVLNQHKIVTLFTNLTEIYDTCEIQTDLRTVSMSPVICQCHCAIGPLGHMVQWPVHWPFVQIALFFSPSSIEYR